MRMWRKLSMVAPFLRSRVSSWSARGLWVEGHTQFAEPPGLFYALQETIDLEESPQFMVIVSYFFGYVFSASVVV